MDWNTQFAQKPLWTKSISRREEKEKVAQKLAALAQNGQVIGAGSGSTSYLALLALAERVRQEKLDIRLVPTSYEIQLICAQMGLALTSLAEVQPDWCYDGADEVDPHLSLIKGRGGAMLREKLVIAASAKSYILVDESKLVQRLGEKFAVPVEIIPEAVHLVERGLQKLGATEIQLRMAQKKDGPVISENSNLILDVRFEEIGSNMETEIKSIVGVVESGLFMGYNVEIVTPL